MGFWVMVEFLGNYCYLVAYLTVFYLCSMQSITLYAMF